MRNLFVAFVLAGSITLLGSQARAAVDCSGPDFQSVRDDILASCGGDSCSTHNHGHFVSCVAHKVKDAVADGLIANNCKGKVVRCGARSTCGKKEGFVTCAICDPGTCLNGFCDDGVTACVDSTECVGVVRRCSTKSDASRCVAPPSSAPGTTAVVGSGSCCAAACPLPE